MHQSLPRIPETNKRLQFFPQEDYDNEFEDVEFWEHNESPKGAVFEDEGGWGLLDCPPKLVSFKYMDDTTIFIQPASLVPPST